jgi:selenocysteine lyase/cysteine desulfurase
VLQSKEADALVQEFAARDVVVSSRHDGLRISFHVYNTLEDVQAVLQLLEENLDRLVTEPVASGG